MRAEDGVPSGRDGDEAVWPAFYDAADMELLETSVRAAARDDAERLTFLALLRAAYDQSRQLERLYDELPGVFTGDAEGADRFRGILDEMPHGAQHEKVELRDLGRIDFDALPDCTPQHMVKPLTIYALRLGVEVVVHGDAETRQRYVAALRGAWRSAWIDSLYAHAAEPRDAGDAGGLGQELRHLAKRVGPELDRITLPHRDPEAGVLPCELKRELIEHLGLGMLQFAGPVGRATPLLLLPASTYIDGMTHLSPNSGCAGMEVTLHGSFPSTQPLGVSVVVGTVAATVVSWTSSTIKIQVPVLKGHRHCVAFRDAALEAEREKIWAQSNQTIVATGGQIGLDGPPAFGTLPYVPDSPPCLGWNELTDDPPKILFFLANGKQKNARADRGESVVLSWKTEKADSVGLTQKGTIGPGNWATSLPLETTGLDIGKFFAELVIPAFEIYTLTATSHCGTTTAVVGVQYWEEPTISITSVEVVQVIQTPANSVRLVANKRTMVRVTVDSGLRSGFVGIPNGFANAVAITGRARVLPTGAPGTIDAGEPINSGGTALARPPGVPSRTFLNDTLNFELPASALAGMVRIDVDVFVPGHEKDPPGRWHANSSTVHTFEAQAPQALRPVLINHVGAPKSTPTMADFAAVLPGAQRRFPLAENGFTLAPPVTLVAVGYALNLYPLPPVGWYALLSDVTTAMMVTSPAPGIVAALLPNNPYSPLGIAHGQLGGIPAVQISMAGDPRTFAHEMGHSFSVWHSPCPVFTFSDPLATPILLEPGLPGRTEDIGIDVAGRTVIPANSGEIMSYCSPQWPSIVFYDSLVFNRVPVP